MRRLPVHPRVGGEHEYRVGLYTGCDGSSPRGRGTLCLGSQSQTIYRFIPAWAGNTQSFWSTTTCRAVHPRVGGEHSGLEHSAGLAGGSSPRGRGTRLVGVAIGKRDRFIPAWAGNTLDGGSDPSVTTVHPRVGGEHRLALVRTGRVAGSSPRGRGTRHQWSTGRCFGRFIPAWAGNTCPARVPDCPIPVHPRVGGEHVRF